MAAAIHLVATPIGNLEDITLRALRVLREVDLIACEDTRRTRKLLEHYGIAKPLVSCHEHNETERGAELARRAAAGESIALVSDAGAPGVSDPGYRVVEAALAAGVAIIPVPGPSAVETALTASGLPTDSFRFGGFLPARSGRRRRTLEALRDDPSTLVFFEAPHRVVAALEDALEVLGERPVVIARELTKLHEEFLRGSTSEVLAELRAREAVKGEITLLIGRGRPVVEKAPGGLEARVAELIDAGRARMAAIKEAARERGLSKREAYRLLEQSGGRYDEPDTET